MMQISWHVATTTGTGTGPQTQRTRADMLWMPDIFSSLKTNKTSILRNVRLPVCAAPIGLPVVSDGLVAADITVIGSRLAAIAPGSDGGLGGAMLWPGAIDAHTHIDKGQVYGRSPNKDGTFAGAQQAAAADRQHFPGLDDLRLRADFALRTAHSHGTVALRSHVDTSGDFPARFAVLCELAQDWAGDLAVQLAPFTGVEEPPEKITEAALAARHSTSGVLSAFLYECSELTCFLDVVCTLATRHDLALDFHADETLDPASHCTRAVAQAVLRNRFEGPVLVGHCCSLAVQSTAELDLTLDLVAQAKLNIVSLPMCNTYLMSRQSGTPRIRGFAPVHEMRARGIKVILATDNSRDGFHAYGDLDMPELFRDAARIMQLDHPIADWPQTVLGNAAQAIDNPELGQIRVGRPADFILFKARNWNEFIARPQSDRIVVRGGQPLQNGPPDFRELDELKGMRV